jgi:hypothetical protein
MEKGLNRAEAFVPLALAAKTGRSLTPEELAFVKRHLEKRRREAKAKEKPR